MAASNGGALHRALGGSVRKAAAATAAKAAGKPVTNSAATNAGRGYKGALSRVLSQVSAQSQKNPQPVKGNHMFRNAGPIKGQPATAVSTADDSIAATGEGLRKIVGRLASRGRVAAARGGKAKKYAEGGKVGTALSALRQLAKKYQAAIDSGDTALARRLKRQLDSEGYQTEDTKVGEEKAKTFSKGGKVSAAIKAKREWLKRAKSAIEREFRKSAKMKDDEPVRVRFGKDETTHVNARGKKYSFQAGSDDDRYDFRSDDGENVPVEFTDDMFE